MGARVVAAHDDTVEYWALNATVQQGDSVKRNVLVPTRIRLSSSVADSYLRTNEELPAALDQLRWARSGGPGTLVERTAMVQKGATGLNQLPLSVAAGAAPSDLERGDLVDVWVGPGPGDELSGKTERVLEAVRIVQAGDDSGSLGGALAQTVLVEVPKLGLSAATVGTVAAGHVTLVRTS